MLMAEVLLLLLLLSSSSSRRVIIDVVAIANSKQLPTTTQHRIIQFPEMTGPFERLPTPKTLSVPGCIMFQPNPPMNT